MNALSRWLAERLDVVAAWLRRPAPRGRCSTCGRRLPPPLYEGDKPRCAPCADRWRADHLADMPF